MKVNLLSNTNRIISKSSANALERSGIAQAFAKSKVINKTIDRLQMDHALMWFGLISVSLKDAIGMATYYYQSVNNKKIPEEKRKYVASYELANGAINIMMPFILGFTIQHPRVQNEIAYRLFGKKYYVDPAELAKATGSKLEELTEKAAKYKKLHTGLTQFLGIVLATIVAKRMIAPFIAGPLAAKYKEKYLSKVDPNVEYHVFHTPNGTQTGLFAATNKMTVMNQQAVSRPVTKQMLIPSQVSSPFQMPEKPKQKVYA